MTYRVRRRVKPTGELKLMKRITSGRENRTTWMFVIEDGGSAWSWEKVPPDGDAERSANRFSSLEECARDASSHGYGAWLKHERRRATPGFDALEAYTDPHALN